MKANNVIIIFNLNIQMQSAQDFQALNPFGKRSTENRNRWGHMEQEVVVERERTIVTHL